MCSLTDYYQSKNCKLSYNLIVVQSSGSHAQWGILTLYLCVVSDRGVVVKRYLFICFQLVSVICLLEGSIQDTPQLRMAG